MKPRRILKLEPINADYTPPKYRVTEGGIIMGSIWSHGAVTDNDNRVISRVTVDGLAKLLCMEESEAREFLQRELDRLHPDWKGLP